jgi:hypothetical protein
VENQFEKLDGKNRNMVKLELKKEMIEQVD